MSDSSQFWGEALSDEDFQDVLSQAVPDGATGGTPPAAPESTTPDLNAQAPQTPPQPPAAETPQTSAAQPDGAGAAPGAADQPSSPSSQTPPPTDPPAPPPDPQDLQAKLEQANRQLAGWQTATQFAAQQAQAQAAAQAAEAKRAQEEAIAQQLEEMLANGELPPEQARFVSTNLRAWERERTAQQYKEQLTKTTATAEQLAKMDTMEYWGDQFQLTKEERAELARFNDPHQMGAHAKWVKEQREKMSAAAQEQAKKIAELEMRLAAQERGGNPVDRVDGQPGASSHNPDDAEDFDEFFARLGPSLPAQFNRAY